MYGWRVVSCWRGVMSGESGESEKEREAAGRPG